MATQTRFNANKIRTTFYDWHGGMSSPLYAAASSGLVADVHAVAMELRACAESLWTDPKSFRKPDGAGATMMRSTVYREWLYLGALADALPDIAGPEFVHPTDGKRYRAMPWNIFHKGLPQ